MLNFNLLKLIFTETSHPKKQVMFAYEEERPENRLDTAPLPPTEQKVERPAKLLDIAVPPPNERASLALQRRFGPKRQVIPFTISKDSK